MRRSRQTAVTARSVSVLTPVVLFVLGASGPRAARAQVPSDPCAQLTPAQVSAALGETVATGQQAGTKTCSWSANKPTHQVVSLMFTTLYVKKGRATFMVRVYGVPDPGRQPAIEKPIARAVAAKV